MMETLMIDLPMNVFAVPFTGDGFQLGDRMIPATIALRRALKGQLQSGQRFDFGIYPEHVKIEAALPHVMGTITMLETLDDHILVRSEVPALVGAVPIVFILKPHEIVPEIGQIVPLKFDLKQMFLFESKTGNQIFPLTEN